MRPDASNLNFVAGQTVPNLITVKTGANGKVNVFNSTGAANVIADVVGYYTSVAPPGGGRFTPLTPDRVLDTRTGIGRGGVAGAVDPGQSIDLQVTGVGGVPVSGINAVALNVTVDQPSASGFVTTWPTGEPRPNASTHNFVPNLTAANLVLAKVGANGKVSLFNSSGATHLIADVVGYFSASGGAFVPVTPERLLDTRDGTGGVLGALGPTVNVGASLADGTPVPSSATAVIVNITAVNSTLPSYVTAWPAGLTRPTASIMNPRPGVPVPNQAYLKLGPGGMLDVFNFTGSTDVVIDVFGYIQ
ncbi:MAG: polysaccharide deacetylase [Acidimicrobiaceae bacterium]|nr:MAG: polysaccharide deacetylase [Acidimicrobiaceae bacterium]